MQGTRMGAKGWDGRGCAHAPPSSGWREGPPGQPGSAASARGSGRGLSIGCRSGRLGLHMHVRRRGRLAGLVRHAAIHRRLAAVVRLAALVAVAVGVGVAVVRALVPLVAMLRLVVRLVLRQGRGGTQGVRSEWDEAGGNRARKQQVQTHLHRGAKGVNGGAGSSPTVGRWLAHEHRQQPSQPLCPPAPYLAGLGLEVIQGAELLLQQLLELQRRAGDGGWDRRMVRAGIKCSWVLAWIMRCKRCRVSSAQSVAGAQNMCSGTVGRPQNRSW